MTCTAANPNCSITALQEVCQPDNSTWIHIVDYQGQLTGAGEKIVSATALDPSGTLTIGTPVVTTADQIVNGRNVPAGEGIQFGIAIPPGQVGNIYTIKTSATSDSAPLAQVLPGILKLRIIADE